MQTNVSDKIFTSVFKRKDFGLNLIWIGCIFLINPYYGLIDILPDFLGLILIYNGLTKLADLDLKLQGARKRFFYSIFVGCALFLLMIFVIIFNFDQTTSLSICLSGMILWLIFLIPGYTKIFEGISYLKIRKQGTNENIGYDNEKLKIFTIFFIILKSILTLLPDLITLILTDISISNPIDFNYNLIYITTFIISSIVIISLGVVWVLKLKKYIKDVVSDTEFISHLNTRYENEIASDRHLLNVRKIKMFSILCICAYACTLCIPNDGYHYLPEFGFAICLYFAYYQAREYIKNRKEYNKYLIIFFISSLVTYILRFVYTSNFNFINMPFSPKEANPVLFWSIYLSCAIFGTFSYLIMIKISKLMRASRDSIIDECVGIKNTESKYRLELDEQRKKELKTKSKVVYIIQYVYAIVSIVCMLLIPFNNVLIPFALYWTYRLITCVILMVSMYFIGADMNDEAEKMI